jgi:hypothetical protein
VDHMQYIAIIVPKEGRDRNDRQQPEGSTNPAGWRYSLYCRLDLKVVK